MVPEQLGLVRKSVQGREKSLQVMGHISTFLMLCVDGVRNERTIASKQVTGESLSKTGVGRSRQEL